MKLDARALAEIIKIIQDGLLLEQDISQQLRDLDLEPSVDGALKLTDEYVSRKIV